MNWLSGVEFATSTATEVPDAPPGAARLLPGGGDAARIAEQHRRVEAADVDAQLERVGGDDAQHRAVAQAALDLAPLQRQVAAAVAADHALGARPRLERLLQVGDQHLGGQPRRREHDRLQPLASGTTGPRRARSRAPSGGCRAAGSPPAGCRSRSSARRAARRSGRSSVISRPVSASASSCGLPMVADEQRNCGSRAVERGTAGAGAGRCWPRASRRRRGGCAARRRPRSAGSRTASPTWCGAGRMPLCSMSGFVTTMWARARMALRASCGVSPS